MKKIGKKLIGIVLIGIICFHATRVLAITESELNNQKQQNNQKMNEVQQKEKEVQNIKDETVKEVEKLTTQIGEYQDQISDLNTQIEEANQKILDATEKLTKAQEDYKKQEDTLNERMVALYEAGETSYLDVLLSSQSITDFISNYYLISEVAECDLALLEKIDKQKQEIEKAKNDLENSKNELTNAKNDKQKVTNDLQSAKKEKDSYVGKLSEEQKKLQQQIEELQKDNVTIDQKIKQKQAEAKKKLEEEQKKQNNQSGNSGGSSNTSGGGSSSTQKNPSGFIYPVPSAYAKITTGWYYSDGRLHGASDFGTGGIAGQPVYAVADGVVVTTERLTTSYGNYIIIMHNNGLYTLYAHGQAGSIAVSENQYVKQGQQIMRVGNTGNSFGAHLHFEVRTSPGLYQNRVNPVNYLP
jgi:murein DD-endopeptidase MepM/ murein hydrolase activator NlpD